MLRIAIFFCKKFLLHEFGGAVRSRFLKCFLIKRYYEARAAERMEGAPSRRVHQDWLHTPDYGPADQSIDAVRLLPEDYAFPRRWGLFSAGTHITVGMVNSRGQQIARTDIQSHRGVNLCGLLIAFVLAVVTDDVVWDRMAPYLLFFISLALLGLRLFGLISY